MSDENFIYGRNPVEEQIRHGAEHVVKLFIKEHLKGAKINSLMQSAREHRIPVQRVPGKKLYDLVGGVNDQGVVAQITDVTHIELQDWIDQTDITTNPGVLLLDEIEDPQNFGAIVRSGVAAGISGIIIGKHRQAPVNPAVVKAAAGTLQHIPIIRVTNINQSILTLKEVGFWIMGIDQNGEQNYWQANYDMPLCIVLGSENKGIRKKTLEHCDFTVRIPMAEAVESLNVSVSSALLCYERLRQRK